MAEDSDLELEIAILRDKCTRLEEGLREYAECIWREKTYMGRQPEKSLEQFVDEAVKEYS